MRASLLAVLFTVAAAAADGPQSQYAPHRQITRENVATLKSAWTFHTGESLEPASGGGRPPAFEATPVYANGLLYIGTPNGGVFALDAGTGAKRWSFDAKIDRKGSYGDFANRGVSIWLDPAAKPGAVCRERIFFASVDARLFALDSLTGKPCAGFGRKGHIDLTEGLRRKPEYKGEYAQTSPPAVIDGLVIAGSAVADNHRQDSPSGEVRAFDAVTGALRWTWDPLASAPGAGGANAWSRIVIDPQRHLVFIPTGSASPDYYGGLRPGDNRSANSVVALNAKDGRLVWQFQTVHHDLWDYDVATPPALFTMRRDGSEIAAVAAGSKTGHLFLLNRETGQPLFPVEERPVPKSDVPGEEAAPTQPFPTLPPSLVPQKLAEEDIWGPTEADRQFCKDAISKLRNEGIFTPPSLRGTLVIPGNIGGLHWGGVAADAERGILVAPANQIAAVVRLMPREDTPAYRKEHRDWETTGQRGAPYAMSRVFLRSPSGLPCNRPPFGTLTGIDAPTGKIRWQVPLGQLPMPGATPEMGSINLGGPLATAGGVVFIGASIDPAMRAFDVETGKQLWLGALPASARSVPMSYMHNGKQYVAIAAGGHDPAFGKLDNAIVVFALP